jgi:hypothetical protein
MDCIKLAVSTLYVTLNTNLGLAFRIQAACNPVHGSMEMDVFIEAGSGTISLPISFAYD